MQKYLSWILAVAMLIGCLGLAACSGTRVTPAAIGEAASGRKQTTATWI